MSKKNSCIVRGCTLGISKGKTVFKLPKDDARLKSWLLVCHREDLLVNESDIQNNYGICEQHFEPKYVTKTKTRTVLLPNACPTIFRKTKNKICDIKPSTEIPAKIFVASDRTLKTKKIQCIDLTKEETVKTKTKKVKLNPYIQKSSAIRQIPTQIPFKRPSILRKTVKPQTKLMVSESNNTSTSEETQILEASTSNLQSVSSNSSLWAAPISVNQVNAASSGSVGIIPTNTPNTILCFTPVSKIVPKITVKSKPLIYFAPVNAQANAPDVLPIEVSTQEKEQTQATTKTYIAAAHNELNIQDKNAEVFVLEKPSNFDHDSNTKINMAEIMEIIGIPSSQNKTTNKETENKQVDDVKIHTTKTTTLETEAEVDSASNLQVQIQDDFNSKNDSENKVVESPNTNNVVNPFTLRIKSIGMLRSKKNFVNKEIRNNNLNNGRKDSSQEKRQMPTTTKTYKAAAHNKLSVQEIESKVSVDDKPDFEHDSNKKIDSTELMEIIEISSSQNKTINKKTKNKHVDDVKIHPSNKTNLETEAELDSASNLQIQIQDNCILIEDSANNVVETLNSDNAVNPFTLRIKSIGMLSSNNDSVNKEFPIADSTQEKRPTTAKTYKATAHNKLSVQEIECEVSVDDKPDFEHYSNNKIDNTELIEIIQISSPQNKTINKETGNKHADDVKIHPNHKTILETEAELDSASNLKIQIQDNCILIEDSANNVVDTLNSDNAVNPFTLRIKSIGMLNSNSDSVNKGFSIADSTQEKRQTPTTAKTYKATAHNKLSVQEIESEVSVDDKPDFEHDSNNKIDNTELMEIIEISSPQNKTINKETENKHADDTEAELEYTRTLQFQIQDNFTLIEDSANNVVETFNSDNVANPVTLRIKSIGMLSSNNDSVNKGFPIADSTQEKRQTPTTAKTYKATAHNKLSVQEIESEVSVGDKPDFEHDSNNKIDNTELIEIIEISSPQNKTINKETGNKHADDVKIHPNNKTTLETEAELDSTRTLQFQIQDNLTLIEDSANNVVETLNSDNVANPFTLRIKSIGMLSSNNDSVNKGFQNNDLNNGRKVSTQEKQQTQIIAKTPNFKVVPKKYIGSTELKEIMKMSSSQKKTIIKKIEKKDVNQVKILNSNFILKKDAGLDLRLNLVQNDFNSKNDAANKVVKTLNPDDVNPSTLRVKSIDMLSSKNDTVNKGIQNTDLNKGKKDNESQESILQSVLQKAVANINQIKSSPVVHYGNVTQRTAPLTERHQSYVNQMFCTFSGCSTKRVDENSNFHHFPDEINSAIHWLVLCKRPDILLKTRPEIKKFCGLSVGVCSVHKEVIEKEIAEGTRRYQDYPWYRPPAKNISQAVMNSTVTEEIIDVDNENDYVPTKDYCAIFNCLTCASDPIKKYRFPSDPDLLAEWRKAAGITIKLTEEEYRKFFVCRKHFDESQFTELGTLILTSVPRPHTEHVEPTAKEDNSHWEKEKEKTSSSANNRLKNIKKVSTPKKNMCVIKHCGAVGPANRLYSFPDPVKEQVKFLNWARAIENKKTLSLQLMEKYAGAEICIKHFEEKYQIGGLFIKDNAIPSLYLSEVSPEPQQNTKQYTIAVPEFLEVPILVPPQQIQTSIVEPLESLQSYHMTPKEENAFSPVWKASSSGFDPKCESRDTQVRGNAKLYNNGIEFINIKRALKYGKNCPKIEPFNFPFKVVRSKKSIRYGKQNIDHGFRMQIHTAIVVDDDDECEREAISAITRIVAKNASIIPKRPPRRTCGKLKVSNIVNK